MLAAAADFFVITSTVNPSFIVYLATFFIVASVTF